MKKGILFLSGILLLCFIGGAEARPKKVRLTSLPTNSCTELFCSDWDMHSAQGPGRTTVIPAPVGTRTFHHRGEVIGGRPSGCPHRYCGCGASIHLFGKIVPGLNLSSNWLGFPRSSAAPDTVAVRRGHVFVLKEHVSGDTWLVHDSNSGRGKTRLHHRSIRGYVIVNPRGGNRYASL